MATTDRDRPDSLSVAEMLRIMDVATALRQDREVVQEQLDLGTLKGRLKERMIAASRVTGEAVTPEEVDAAIEQYYARLHTFHEPPWGLSIALAHLWVLRGKVLGWGGAALASIALAWWLFLWKEGPLSVTGGAERRVERLAAEVASRGDAIETQTRDGTVNDRVDKLRTDLEVARVHRNLGRIEAIRDELSILQARLDEEYTIDVVSGAGRQSAVDRTPKAGGSTSYYLIVEARKPDGSPLRRPIRNEATGRKAEVTTWAERVPQAVFDRLKKDKADDGLLSETAFAVKKRGLIDPTVTMKGEDGKPLARMGQITEW